MAETLTSMMELVKPEVNGSPNVWGQRLNEDLDKLDSKFFDLSGILKTAGTATAYTLTATGPALLKDGTGLRLQAHIASGASPTLSINGLTAKPLVYYDINGTAALVGAGMIRLNAHYDVRYEDSIATLAPSGAYIVTSGITALNASLVANVPAGSIAATTVQAALDELDTEKAPKLQPVITGAAAQLAATLTSTHASGTLINIETSGVVTGSLLASSTGLAIGTGPSGQTLSLLDTGNMNWSGNRVRITGTTPGIELVDTDVSANPTTIFTNGGVLVWANTAGSNVFTVSATGYITAIGLGANSTAGNAINGITSNGYGVYGESSNNHGVAGKTTNAGSGGVVGISSSNITGILGFGSFGVYTASNTYSGGGYTSSDERLKENVETAPLADILDRIQRFRVVEFDWRENTDAYISGKRREIGVLAQEVQAVLPALILPVTPPTPIDGQEPTLNQQLGETLTINSAPLIYYLLAAVQRLAALADPLTTRTSKYRMFERMTAEEVGQFVFLMGQQPQKRQMLFDHCTYLAHDDPFFAELRYAMEVQWGADRMEEVLAADDPV